MKFQQDGHIYLYYRSHQENLPLPQRWPQYGLWTKNSSWRQYPWTEGEIQPLSWCSALLWSCRQFCLCPSKMRPTHKSPSGWGQVSWEARSQVRWSQRSGLRSTSETFWMCGRVNYPSLRQMAFLPWFPWSRAPPAYPGRPLCSSSASGERCGEGRSHAPCCLPAYYSKNHYNGRKLGLHHPGHILGGLGQSPDVLAVDRIVLEKVWCVWSHCRRYFIWELHGISAPEEKQKPPYC